MSKHRSLRVALLGAGDQAECWTAIVQGLAEVRPWPEQLPGDIDALILVRGATDPVSKAREALLADIPVLYAAPFQLSPWQVGDLVELGRRQERVLRFAELLHNRRGMTFLQRLLEGEEPLWRPLYLRSVHGAASNGSERIDEIVTEELAICDALLGTDPQCITVVASRCAETGDVCAIFLTLEYGDGRVASCTVSLAEADDARHLVVVMPDRTAILDDRGGTTSARIVGSGEQDRSDDRVNVIDTPAVDPAADEVRCFLAAVAAGDQSLANGDRWTRVAALSWAARQSISFGGSVEVLNEALYPMRREPPPLRVIEGGGNTTPTAKERPPLTLVAT